jgi:hypothetical protein
VYVYKRITRQAPHGRSPNSKLTRRMIREVRVMTMDTTSPNQPQVGMRQQHT